MNEFQRCRLDRRIRTWEQWYGFAAGLIMSAVLTTPFRINLELIVIGIAMGFFTSWRLVNLDWARSPAELPGAAPTEVVE